MAKFTVSADHVAKYPSLEKFLGQTVDASVLRQAASDAKVNAKDAKKANANIVTPAPVAAPKKKVAAKKVAGTKKPAASKKK